MSLFRRMFALAVVCLASFSAAQRSDQIAAAGVLGPHWRQMSRSAGMIFSGTVLGIEAQPAGKRWPLPLILTKFRIDRAIVGVHPGEVLTVREWAGAWSMHRSMSGGERMLIFLYPKSRLGLTSPVGGRLGQVTLDSRGEVVRIGVPDFDGRLRLAPPLKRCSTQRLTAPADCATATQPTVTLSQLERAIRYARKNFAPTTKE